MGVFQTASSPYGNWLNDVYCIDVDGDSLLDLLAVDLGSGRFSVLLNQGSASAPSFGPVLDISGPSGNSHSTVGDINSDGLPDLVLVNANRIAVFLAESSGDQWTGTYQRVDLSVLQGGYDVRIADLDGDGAGDIVVTGIGYIGVFYGIGQGSSYGFGSLVAFPINAGQTISLAVVDLDNDSNLDIVVGLGGVPGTTVLFGQSVGGARPTYLEVPQTNVGNTYAYGYSLVASDLNGGMPPDWLDT